MLKLRVYIDTSVVGGCLDEEFKEDSVQLFDEFIKGMKTLVISDILLFELEGAPKEVKNILRKVSTENIEYVSLNEESITLANTYIAEGAVAEKSLLDARHIAIATVERVDVLVSWNFKHIVNINRIHLLNSANLKLGYPILDIRSPKEVLYESQEI
ncbi:MAG: PIN domain protein [Thermoplasmata archaeon]|nr:PIN domain protein [Thermoplasmata archaeon]